MRKRTTKDLADEIEHLRAKQGDLVLQLDAAILEYAPELSSLAIMWIDREVRVTLQELAPRVAGMPDSRLKDFKQRVAHLKTKLPEAATAIVAESKFWPHAARPENLSGNYFSAVMRTIVSTLGTVLADFDLLPKDSSSYPRWRKQGDRYSYEPSLGLPAEPGPAVSRYKALSQEHHGLTKEITEKTHKLVQLQATERFDSL